MNKLFAKLINLRMLKSAFNLLLCLFLLSTSMAQTGYWQQAVAYEMVIDFDHEKHQFKGSQRIAYTNHSPDTLRQIFYHLYFNAFQPGSMMDVKSRTVPDPDPRIGDRISNLKPDEIGYHRIKKLEQDGKKLDFDVIGTVVEVRLNQPLLPGASTELTMQFESQIPMQIRRSGRNNEEGVAYTLTQWYPKLAEYDREGWHTDPYVAREFHGVFGSFDITINIDSSFTLAGTGVVQNPEEVGHGYSTSSQPKKTTSWHFKADRVHDFAWAADPDYKHLQTELENGQIIRFFYKNDSTLHTNWTNLVPYTERLFNIMNDRFGVYPYAEFSVIQAGDGGMEYPMCTMISGTGSFGGLVSVTVHEAIHNWYYGILATNESKYPWMDEGFTTYAQNIVLDSLFKKRRLNPHYRSYRSYIMNANSGKEEPLSTHADWYESNQSYGINAYSKGCVFLHQLSELIGEEAFQQGMKRYFNTWQFKHPTPTDFERVMEQVSDLELGWYFDAWIGTTKQIDYAIDQVWAEGKNTLVRISNKGTFPFPVTVKTVHNGVISYHYIPLQIMRGEKPAPNHLKDHWNAMPDWPWTYPNYTLTLPFALEDISAISLNPFEKVADVNPENESFPYRIISYPSTE